MITPRYSAYEILDDLEILSPGLHFAGSFHWYPTWPYLARPITRPKYRIWRIFPYLGAYSETLPIGTLRLHLSCENFEVLECTLEIRTGNNWWWWGDSKIFSCNSRSHPNNSKLWWDFLLPHNSIGWVPLGLCRSALLYHQKRSFFLLMLQFLWMESNFPIEENQG